MDYDLAPRPGSRAEEEKARQFLRLRVQDWELDLVLNLTMQEKFLFRKATRSSFEEFMDAGFGEDALFVLWWLARRQNGEPNLPIAQAEAEWPEKISEDDLDLKIVDLDEDPGDDSNPNFSESGSPQSDPT